MTFLGGFSSAAEQRLLAGKKDDKRPQQGGQSLLFQGSIKPFLSRGRGLEARERVPYQRFDLAGARLQPFVLLPTGRKIAPLL